MACRACWRMARCGPGACAPAPTIGARTQAASGCSWPSLLAIADGDRAARGFDRFLGEFDIRDLLDCRLPVLVDVTVIGAVVDRPLGARRVKAGIDRPDAILG